MTGCSTFVKVLSGLICLVFFVSSSMPCALAQNETKSFHEGSDFKIGPVTDDSKLIKPVAGENNESLADDKKEPTDKKASEEQAGMKDQRKTNVEYTFGQGQKISVGALRIAKELDILDDMIELEKLKAQKRYGKKVYSPELLSVRLDLDEQLFAAFMQTRRVISELDRQISGFAAIQKVLEDKRDQAVRTNNIVKFSTSGTLASTQGALSIGTPTSFQNTGNTLAAIAGGLTVLISTYALKLQKGGKRSAERDPNMLAPVFDLTPVEPNKYPPVIWNFLNDYEPDQKLTRREQLIERWKTLKYIDKKDRHFAEHLEQLAGTVPMHNTITIDLLRSRIPMLEDLRATVAGVNEYLDEILTVVRNPNKVELKYHDPGTTRH